MLDGQHIVLEGSLITRQYVDVERVVLSDEVTEWHHFGTHPDRRDAVAECLRRQVAEAV